MTQPPAGSAPSPSDGLSSPCGDAVARGAAGVVVERLDGTIVDANASACVLLGYERAELVGRPYTALCVPDERAGQAALRAALVAGKRRSHIGRWHLARRDGTTLTGDVITSRTPIDADVPDRITWVLHERVASASDDLVTDAPIAAERLESLGLLAGGIAHDFNNVLAVIRGNVEFARDELLETSPDVRAAVADLQAVERATDRATALVRQLLAFGRMQARSPEPLDLNALVRDVSPLLRISVGAEARLTLRLAPELPRVLADRTQVEQVVMNLVGNARDAITEAVARDTAGGVEVTATRRLITIATSFESLDAAGAGRVGLGAPGGYVRLAVRDAGIGMTDATRARIFDPFFTTKPMDRGTGLGLAASWGVVRQSGGAIHVESRWSEGSTFAVYLPALAEHAPADDALDLPVPYVAHDAAPAATARPRVDDGASRTVLLAEDEHGVRRVVARNLRDAKYRVLEAGDGDAALELWRRHASEIDLLVADVRMPRLRGDDLARLLRADRPDLPVVLMTGFADGAVAWDDAAILPPLQKPFPNDLLLERIATVLAAAARDSVVR